MRPMNKTTSTSLLATALLALSSGESLAAERKNPFSLVYDGAITRNEPGRVQIHPVTYELSLFGVKEPGFFGI
jgi:uncharacterized protein